MRRIIASTTVLLVSAAIQLAFGRPDFSLVGFAEGVTGGSGGRVVRVSTAADFKTHCESSEKVTLEISGKISNASVSIASNKTLLGVGSTAEITGSTLSLKGSNIIIRNLNIHHQPKGADLITMSGGVSNVWIDHNDLYAALGDLNGDGKVDTEGDISGGDVDWYDGLIDMTKETNNITISWNKIHDSFKAMLVGSSDSDLHDRKITFHHNHFYKLWERVPSYRGGTGHVFNNYFSDIEHSAVNLRMGAKVRVEGNVFERVGSGEVDENTQLGWGPIGAYYSKTKGDWDVKDNQFITCKGSQPTTSTVSFAPPYVYSKVLHPSAEIKTMVTTWAGVGKYDDQSPVSIRLYISGYANLSEGGGAVYNFRGERIPLGGKVTNIAPGPVLIKDNKGIRISRTY